MSGSEWNNSKKPEQITAPPGLTNASPMNALDPSTSMLGRLFAPSCTFRIGPSVVVILTLLMCILT